VQLEQGDQPSVCQDVLHEGLPPDEHFTAIDCGLQGQAEQGKADPRVSETFLTPAFESQRAQSSFQLSSCRSV
jgi:hypothetical protein